MPTEPFITVTLRKDIVKKLRESNPDMPTSTIVTNAIQEYINQKSRKSIPEQTGIAYTIVNGKTTSTSRS